jgi:hypothetical protein
MKLGQTLSTVMLCALALLGACGGDDGDGDGGGGTDAASADLYVGSWRYTGGTLNATCGTPLQPVPLASELFSFTVTRGSGGLTRLQMECSSSGYGLVLESGGAVAKQATCSVSLPWRGMMVAAELRFDEWKMSTTNGLTGTTTGRGTAMVMMSSLKVECSFTEAGQIAKVTAGAPDGGAPGGASADGGAPRR